VLRVGAAGLAPRAMARTGVSLLGLLSLLLLAACRSPFAAPTPLGQRTLQVSVLTSDGTAPTSLPAGQAIVDFTFDSNPGSEERIPCEGTALPRAPANTGLVYFQAPPPAPAGHPFACTYTGQGQTVELTLAAAHPLQLSAPTSGSGISREEPLILTFSGGEPGSTIDVSGGAQKEADAI